MVPSPARAKLLLRVYALIGASALLYVGFGLYVRFTRFDSLGFVVVLFGMYWATFGLWTFVVARFPWDRYLLARLRRRVASPELLVLRILVSGTGLSVGWVLVGVVGAFDDGWALRVPASKSVLLLELCLAVAAMSFLVASVSRRRVLTTVASTGKTVVPAAVLLLVAVVFVRPVETVYGTDAVLFQRYAAQLLLQGENPYTHSMAPAFSAYEFLDQYVTYRLDGTLVTSVSYPALSFLTFLPQVALGVPNINATTVSVFLLVAGYLLYASDGPLRLAVLPVLFVNPSIVNFSSNGAFDVIWMAFLLGAVHYHVADAHLRCGVALGLACAVKQIPWVVLPFLGITLLSRWRTSGAFGPVVRWVVGVLTGFLVPNLPFLIAAPVPWLTGAITPVGGGAPLVQQGVGLTFVSVSNLYSLSHDFHLFAVGVVTVALAGTLSRHGDTLSGVVWFTPALVLWFHYRSLQNYFVFFTPVVYYWLVLNFEGERTDAD